MFMVQKFVLWCFVLSGIKIIYEENLGYIDFHPANHIGVVYAAEADLVTQVSVRRKLAKLRKVIYLTENYLTFIKLVFALICEEQSMVELKLDIIYTSMQHKENK